MMRCPLCGDARAAATGATHAEGGASYTLYACGSCAGQFWWPLANPGAAWYERDERYADRNADPILRPNGKHRSVMDYLGTRPGRVLDVGCGVGNFLALAASRGWECYGIDFDADAIAAGKRTFGLEHLEVASLADYAARHAGETFDLITFFDVLEHLDDHNAFLESVTRLLAPSGAVALSVPYRYAWRWLIPNDLPPRHLTRWDERSLANILARHGLAIAFVSRYPASLRFIVMKLRFRFGGWATFGLVRRAKQSTPVAAAAPSSSASRPLAVRLVHAIAIAKDFALFGVPATLIWLALLPTRTRYTDITLVARRAGQPGTAR